MPVKLLLDPLTTKTKVKIKWRCGITPMLSNIHLVRHTKKQKLHLLMIAAEVSVFLINKFKA